MRRLWYAIGLFIFFSDTSGVRAGLYYRGEQIAELPSQWRGFLLDQRLLRSIAVSSRPGSPANPARERYRREAERLAGLQQPGKHPTAEDLADLGALYIRLGEASRAVDVLRTAGRQFPNDFRIASNLGTAWQLQGDLEQAALSLREAVKLAPATLRQAEEYQLNLVGLRLSQPKAGFDDLFSVCFVTQDGSYQPGRIGEAQRKKLPREATAIVQRLALWLPADGKLLWQLAELANAQGDVQAAVAIMDGCVTEFGMHDPKLRRHRQALRAAADLQAKSNSAGNGGHSQHAALVRPRSRRPLITR